MDDVSNPVKSPDLINFNDTDTDAEIQYRSLQTANGIVTAVDTDEPPDADDSHSASSPCSDSPKRTPGVHMSEERRQLLDTGEDSDEDARVGSTDCAADSEDEETDVWLVTSEQRQYYIQQFITLQPDIHGVVPGHVAKAFFEKSKLPVVILSQIWNLADVTKDGCLCLQEFITAMHLVVLRRNNIDVPDHLPVPLVPRVAAARTDGNHLISDRTPNSTANNSIDMPSPKGREWTKFLESPMSGVSSPGVKPVNFDFHKSSVDQNPRIVHPVAVRGTREEHERLRSEDSDDFSTTSPEPPLSHHEPSIAFSRAHVKKLGQSASIPSHAGDSSGPTSLPVFNNAPVLPARAAATAAVPPATPVAAAAPPPPPPRPSTGGSAHTRSSSLDLSRVPTHPPPPPPPPRGSPPQGKSSRSSAVVGNGSAVDDNGGVGFADFTQFSGTTTTASSQSRRRSRHTAAYYKPTGGRASPSSTDVDDEFSPSRLCTLSAQQLISMGNIGRDRLLQLIRVQRERISTLSQVSAELNQELSETVEERVALEIQLDHMRPDND